MRVVRLLSAAAALGGVSVALGSAASLPVAEPSYVVQIHASRDGFVPPPVESPEQLRTQLMTTESGQRFECFLPLSPLQKQAEALKRAAAKQIAASSTTTGDGDEENEKKENDNVVAFARAATKKIRPMCLQYVDVVDRWVYEICPGVLIRKVDLKRKPKDTAKKPNEEASTKEEGVAAADTAATEDPQAKPAKVHEVQELAAFESDEETKLPLPYEEFTHGDVQAKLSTYKKPMYTQVFRARGTANGQMGDIQIQFFCSASTRDDAVAAVDWRYGDDTRAKEPAAFAIASRLFCNAKHSDPDEKFSVGQLLQPLVEMRTCIKRNEGWWTYEFCFGQGIRQYHRESDGKVTAEFSLGVYDVKQNELLDTTGASLVTEHIDATHDAARPAFVESYGGGTHCKEFDVLTPRKSRVFFYCSQGSAHHIMSVKETQTCTYTVKISSPVVCDHPHFITEEEKTEDKAEIVHCIPVATHDNENTPTTSESTRAPSTAPTPANGERSEVVEVEVPAT